MLKQLLSLLATLLLLVGCADRTTITGSEPPAGTPSELALRQNEANRLQLTAIINEVEPHVRFDDDGTWSINPAVQLSPAAAQFVVRAQRASAEAVANGATLVRAPNGEAGEPQVAAATTPNQQGIRFHWWGARISMRSGVARGINYAWHTAGGAHAVRVFLNYYGYSGWAVGAAGVLVPAYAVTIYLVDRIGGYRGVHMNVPWSIIPTYITPQ